MSGIEIATLVLVAVPYAIVMIDAISCCYFSSNTQKNKELRNLNERIMQLETKRLVEAPQPVYASCSVN